MKYKRGFTLIELMVAILLFSIISTISYRIINVLVRTKEVVTATQKKWASLSRFMNMMNTAWVNKMPIPVYGNDGTILPVLYGKDNINSNYDAQLEITVAGRIGDNVQRSIPPKRIGFRFVNGQLFYLVWGVLNRVPSSQPEIYLLLDNVKKLKVEYLYSDGQWHENWPSNGGNLYALPQAMRVTIELNNHEIITREWA